MLSSLRFLVHMQCLQQRPHDIVTPPHLVCDNKGLVTTITTLQSYPKVFPNTTMEAEWDCIAQILQSYHKLGMLSPTIDHIKGHQDEREPYETLPLLAQLNCDADAFATKYLQDHPTTPHRTAHLFPAGECVLQLQHGTIT